MSETIQVLHIPVDKLKVSKLNVRQDVGDISEMTDSIKSVGILEPLLVRPSGRDFEVIVGSRRFSAAKKAGLKRVPAIVKDLKDDEALLESLVENLQRGDIGEEEIVRGYQLLQKFDSKRWTQDAFARKIGKTQTWLSRLLSAYDTVIKLKQAGLIKGMKSYPQDEERERGIAPVRVLTNIDYAMKAPEVKEVYDDKQIDKKRVELAKSVLDLPSDQAEKVIDRFKMYPEKPIRELKQEALATPSGIAIETYVRPSLARQIEEKTGVPVEEALPDLLEKGLDHYVTQELGEEKEEEKPIAKSDWREGLEQDPISVQWANWYKWNQERIGNHFDFFTTHYSQKDLDTFVGILKTYGIKTLIDVRDSPYSQYKPEFNKDSLSKSLKAKGITYVHIPELGVPKEQRNILAKTNDWKEFGLWYKKNVVPRLDGVLNGGTRLKEFDKPYAFMCVEKDPNKCHRQWIVEALEKEGKKSLDL